MKKMRMMNPFILTNIAKIQASKICKRTSLPIPLLGVWRNIIAIFQQIEVLIMSGIMKQCICTKN